MQLSSSNYGCFYLRVEDGTSFAQPEQVTFYSNTAAGSLMWKFPYRYQSVPTWSSTEPDLTIPDLSETIEQIFARRESGLALPLPLMAQRYYPVSPESLVQAKDVVASEVLRLKAIVASDTAIIKDNAEKVEAAKFAKYRAAALPDSD